MATNPRWSRTKKGRVLTGLCVWLAVVITALVFEIIRTGSFGAAVGGTAIIPAVIAGGICFIALQVAIKSDEA